MNILDAITSAENGAAVQQLGSQFGLSDAQTASALAALVPALATGLQRNAQDQSGLGGLVSALTSGNHRRYLEDPSRLADPTTVADGNGILGHVFGSKEVSRDIASRAAQQTGISPDILKRMLPLIAALAMGALSRNAGTSPGATAGAPASGGILDMLTPMLDRNRDGSLIDDMAGMLGRTLGRS
jgi:hypothetical protein